jgi:predicted TIM-barrel fold metal-dependent hydrolase
MPLIDVHTHIGRLLHDLPPNGPEDLIETMDALGIELAAVLAVESPEELDYYVTTEQVLEACALYPDRLLPFCGIDPRRRYPDRFDPTPLISEYAARGCRGFGEVLAGVPVDHPGLQAIYAACGRFGLPVLLHTDQLICRDDPGLPRLERMLIDFPETTFVGHAIRFWAEISADAIPEHFHISVYAAGPIVPGGATDRLLTEYPNLYGDLSGGSGFNALTRDPEFGLDFLERQQDKLLFGTDILTPGQRPDIVEFIRTCAISEEAREKICHRTARRLFGIEESR